MKNFLQFIKEAVGVPDNIVQTSERVYNRIIEELESIEPLYDSAGLTCETLNGYIIKFRENFRIGSRTFPEIEIIFKVNLTTKENQIEIDNLEHSYSAKYGFINKGYRMKKFGGTKKATVVLHINISPKTKIGNLHNFFASNKSYFLSSITHELKHYYDLLIKPETSPSASLDYGSYLHYDSDIYPIYDFIFKLYYFHDIENSVRPSELAGLLSSEGITKSNFKEFFYKTDIWQQIEGAKKLSYEGMKAEMKEYLEEMDEFLKKSGMQETYEELLKDGTFEDELSTKIELTLYKTFEDLKKLKVGELKKILSYDDLHPLRFKNTAREKFLTSYLSNIQKYDEYEDFFRAEINKINRDSDKLFRKVAGVYSITPDDPNLEKKPNPFFVNESVLDWSKWNKWNKKSR